MADITIRSAVTLDTMTVFRTSCVCRKWDSKLKIKRKSLISSFYFERLLQRERPDFPYETRKPIMRADLENKRHLDGR